MNLEVLNDDIQCNRICQDYWKQGEDGKFVLKVRDIAIINKIKPHVLSSYVEQNAYVWLDAIRCVSCRQPYRFGTRYQYQYRSRYVGTTCEDCNTIALRARSEKKKAILMEIRQLDENNKLDINTLDLKSSAYLLAAILALGDEHFNTIEPLLDFPPCTLSPDSAYDQKIIQHLIDKRLILISLNTRQEAIEQNEDGEPYFNLELSSYDLALDNEQTNELISNFFSKSNPKTLENPLDFMELCKEIQLNECIAFLKLTLEQHKLHLSPGKKTYQVFSQCLQNFSVSQVYNFIWRAVRDAAAYYMRSSVSKRQAANSVVGAILRNMEQALANDWDVKPFNRNYNLPQSALSRIIFNSLLDSYDGGFKYQLHAIIECSILSRSQ